MLSLSNEPEKLMNMALDTLTRTLEVDSCWVQTIAGRANQKLLLAAERGLTPEMRHEIAAMDMGHQLGKLVIGLGHPVTIPDLANDGVYGLPSLRASGLRWMVVVPMMTYRSHGILGVASRNRRLLHKYTPDLVMVVGGLIANSLSRVYLSRPSTTPEKQDAAPAAQVPEKQNIPPPAPVPQNSPGLPLEESKEKAAPPAKKNRGPDGTFDCHARKMGQFRRSHY